MRSWKKNQVIRSKFIDWYRKFIQYDCSIFAELIHRSPYEDGWLFKLEITDKSEYEKLLTYDEYKKFLEYSKLNSPERKVIFWKVFHHHRFIPYYYIICYNKHGQLQQDIDIVCFKLMVHVDLETFRQLIRRWDWEVLLTSILCL